MKPLTRLIFLLTWLLAVATILGRFGTQFFVFELLSHFPLQYGLLGIPLLAYWAWQRRRFALLLALVPFLWNSWLVWPWLTAPQPVVTSTTESFRVLHANVLYTEPDEQRIRTLVREEGPDLFVLQELTREMRDRLTDFRRTYPHQLFIWSKGPSHLWVCSKTPFRVDTVAIRANRTARIQTRIQGRDLTLISLHPRTPIFPTWFPDRNQRLAYAARLARQERQPMIWLGDFNITPWSPVYTQVLDHPELISCRRGFGLSPTWISWLPAPLRIPIDHAFINAGLEVVNFRTRHLTDSDHRALIVDLRFANAQ